MNRRRVIPPASAGVRQATLKDVAAAAGVSLSAASFVLGGRADRAHVSDQTRDRIRAAADQLGYLPKFAARAMADRKSYTIAVVCSLEAAPVLPTSATFFANAVQAVEEVCQRAGYNCLYASCPLRDLDRFTMPRILRDGSADGVILCGHAHAEVVRRFRDMGLPCVQVGANVAPDLGVACVYPDLDAGFAAAARMLAGLGHRRVELLLPAGPGPDRLGRAFKALRRSVPGIEPIVTTVPSEWATPVHGFDHARAIAADPRRPTAVITNMNLAEGVVRGMEAAGLDLPQDYSLVVHMPEEQSEVRFGRDGRVVTAVTAPIHTVSAHAARKLFAMLGVTLDYPEPVLESVPATLRLGSTCAPCPTQTLAG